MTFVEVVTTIMVYRILEEIVTPLIVDKLLNKKSKRKGKKK